MCETHDHAIVIRGGENEVLCFQCAVKEVMLGKFIEIEVETLNNYRSCSQCGR